MEHEIGEIYLKEKLLPIKTEICIKEEPLQVTTEICIKEEPLHIKTEICVKEEPLLSGTEYEQQQVYQKLSKQQEEKKFKNLKEEEVWSSGKTKLEELEERERKTPFKILEESKYPLVIVRKLSKETVKDLFYKENMKKDESVPKGETCKTDVSKDGSKRFKCSSCDISFDKKYYLNSHILSSHLKEKMYPCSKCTFDSNSLNILKKHMLHHGKCKLYRCLICGYESDFRNKIKKHEAMCKIKNQEINSKNIFKCDHCIFVCNIEEELESHVLQYHQQKLYKCSHCNCNFRFESRRRLHEQNVHSGTDARLLKCSHCSYQTKDKVHFKMHSLEHSNEKYFTCLECNFKCSYRPRFYIHMLAHRKREFCETCPRQEQNSSFKCGEKEFYKRSKTRPAQNSKFIRFACSQCEYKSKYKCLLNVHIRTYHPKTFKKSIYNPQICKTSLPVSSSKLFACSECDFKTKYKSNLMEHLRKEHFMFYKKLLIAKVKIK